MIYARKDETFRAKSASTGHRTIRKDQTATLVRGAGNKIALLINGGESGRTKEKAVD